MSPRAVPIGTPDEPGDLARKVGELISLKRRPDGEEYTQQEIADGVSALYRQDQIEEVVSSLTETGATQGQIDAAVREVEANSPLIHRTYVGKLKAGTQDNPSRNVLWYLAKWFGVPVSYFFPGEEGEAVQQEVSVLATLRELRDAGQLDQVKALFRTTGDLSPSARQNVLALALAAAQAAKKIHDDAVSGDS